MRRPLTQTEERRNKTGIPHEQIVPDRLWNKRPDGIAFKIHTKTKTRVVYYDSIKRELKTEPIVYYELIKRDLNKKIIFDSRCDGRLNAKSEGCTLLTYTM